MSNTAKKALYVTDLDGTLLNNAAEVSGYTLDTMNLLIDEGFMITYATARSFTSAAQVTSGLNFRLPVATYNGAFIVDPASGEILERCMLDKTFIEPLFKIIRDEKIPTLVYSFVDGRERVSWHSGYQNAQVRQYIQGRGNDPRLRGVDDYNALFEGDLFYFTVLTEHSVDMRIIDALWGNAHVSHILQPDTYDGTWWLEIMRADASKAAAAQKLKVHTRAGKLVCFGDNLNDLPMFEISDECYAVQNANPAVCAAATAVIGSNESDGVAQWLWNERG